MTTATTTRLSLAQCNAMLPLIRAISLEIEDRRTERRRLVRRRDELEHAATPEGLMHAIDDTCVAVATHDDRIQSATAELEAMGLTVLRHMPLTVHFPGRTRTSDQLVFCWQEGEDTVCHGHPVGEEHEPRRPLKVRQD